jgi:hypothetical protein
LCSAFSYLTPLCSSYAFISVLVLGILVLFSIGYEYRRVLVLHIEVQLHFKLS